jgi:hypothetical protein
MSIAKLREVAARQLPLDVSDEDEVDEVRVLMAAGLVAGLRLRIAAAVDSPCVMVLRVLAITPDGRRLLQRNSSIAESRPFTLSA